MKAQMESQEDTSLEEGEDAEEVPGQCSWLKGDTGLSLESGMGFPKAPEKPHPQKLFSCHILNGNVLLWLRSRWRSRGGAGRFNSDSREWSSRMSN